MRYELLKDSCEGVIIDSTPILRDIADTFEVSFLLPDKRAYIALFKGEDDIEHKELIRRDGTAKIPKPILSKEQLVRITVCKIDSERILQSWECWPFRIGAFLHMRKRQWEVAAAEKDILARLAVMTRDNAALQNANRETAELVSRLREELRGQTETLAGLKAENAKLATAYNKSIEVINDLSKRLAAVEKHYDPTLIK